MKKPDIDRNRPLGLYLHIPFCKAKCAYCDFYSLAHSEEKMDAYAAALTRHITGWTPCISAAAPPAIWAISGSSPC